MNFRRFDTIQKEYIYESYSNCKITHINFTIRIAKRPQICNERIALNPDNKKNEPVAAGDFILKHFQDACHGYSASAAKGGKAKGLDRKSVV